MSDSTRRAFLKNAGQGVLAAGLFPNLPEGAWLDANNAYAAEGLKQVSFSSEDKTIEVDVLVIGGGLAGIFSAVKASEKGAKVVLVDKGYVGKSGQSPYANGFLAFNPEWGHKLDDWMNYINKVSEYVNNRYWTETALKDSYARYQDLIAWGVQFKKGADGLPVRTPIGPGVIVESLQYEKNLGEYAQVFRKQLQKSGVKFFDKIMITELLKQEGRVVGAMGFPLESYDTYTFVAKTTIICTGGCSFKPIGYQPLAQLTCDGEAMAYRAGAEILGKEFVDTHNTRVATPGIVARRAIPPSWGAITASHSEAMRVVGAQGGISNPGAPAKPVNAEGAVLPDRPEGVSPYPGTYLQYEFEAHAGRAPIHVGNNEVVGGAALGMSLRKADGLWPADTRCASSLPGLYAAGDALGNMQNGAVYAIGGSSSMGSMQTGAVAGRAAADEALKMEKLTVDEKERLRAKQVLHAPRMRKGGFSPRWVTQLLQNTMMPFYISYIKKADRLQATLEIVEFMKGHLVPCLFSRDPHELRLAHETKNMVLSAEMRLRSALFRTESRGNHYREDYPRRDDKNWLAWSKIKEGQGKMTITKVPMPKEMWPDLSAPYEKRYPYRYPGEGEALDVGRQKKLT